jgi:Cdc6-like AAA superfamily ATPase
LNANTNNAFNNKTAKFTNANKIKKLTLLLGPPGTGKTSTIKHAISAFLLNEQ